MDVGYKRMLKFVPRGFAFVVLELSKVWVKDLLTSTVHVDLGGSDFALSRKANARRAPCRMLHWYSESSLRSEPHWVSWPATAYSPAMAVCKVPHHGRPLDSWFGGFRTLGAWWQVASCHNTGN